jgi:predicted nucleic acid-binding protein
MLRLVLDIDVMVAGLASAAGASRRLLLAAFDGKVRLLLSTCVFRWIVNANSSRS